MHAIILAAGRGSRLSQLNPDQRPKCLLEIGGRSLIERMLRALRQGGVGRCVVVVGYESDRIMEHVGALKTRPEVSFHYNSRFEEGSVISLGLARETLSAGEAVLVLDADVLFHPRILAQLVSTSIENCFLLDRKFEAGAEPVKIAVRDGTMVEFSKQLPPGLEYDSLGESVGFFRFGAACAGRLARRCARFDKEGRAGAPHEDALREELLERPGDFGFVDITGLPWLEIDFPEDVSRAREEVLPAIRAEYPEY